MHRVYVGEALGLSEAAAGEPGDASVLAPGARIVLEGPEATHLVRVKRLGEGDLIGLFDGRGTTAVGCIQGTGRAEEHAREGEGRGGGTRGKEEWGGRGKKGGKGGRGGRGSERAVEVLINEARHVPALRPRLEICTAVPKGGAGGRLDEMVDQLSQAGAAAVSPMVCARSVVEPREGGHKMERLRRICVESAKQCARPWLMEIGGVVKFEEALAAPAGTVVLLADEQAGQDAVPIVGRGSAIQGSGLLAPVENLADVVAAWAEQARAVAQGKSGTHEAEAWRGGVGPAAVRVLIGPEGGWEDQERARALAAGAKRVGLGPLVMRIETAAVAAAVMIMAHARAGHPGATGG